MFRTPLLIIAMYLLSCVQALGEGPISPTSTSKPAVARDAPILIRFEPRSGLSPLLIQLALGLDDSYEVIPSTQLESRKARLVIVLRARTRLIDRTHSGFTDMISKKPVNPSWKDATVELECKLLCRVKDGAPLTQLAIVDSAATVSPLITMGSVTNQNPVTWNFYDRWGQSSFGAGGTTVTTNYRLMAWDAKQTATIAMIEALCKMQLELSSADLPKPLTIPGLATVAPTDVRETNDGIQWTYPVSNNLPCGVTAMASLDLKALPPRTRRPASPLLSRSTSVRLAPNEAGSVTITVPSKTLEAHNIGTDVKALESYTAKVSITKLEIGDPKRAAASDLLRLVDGLTKQKLGE